MNMEEILIALGLKKQLASIYLACLELGLSTASQIAKKADIARPYFYDLVPELINQGYIFQTIHGKKKYYSALDPEKLKEKEMEKLRIIEEALPELKSIHNQSHGKPRVLFYEGRAGLNEVYNDTLKHKGEIIAFITEKFLLADGKQLSKDYIDRRIKIKNTARVIGPISKELAELKSRDKEELRQTKMLPRNIFTSDVEIGVYENKVDFINFNKEFGLIIENKEIADAMKRIFEIVWKGGFVIE
jgi:sugar-specific transcriptional regulator TrmB